MADVTIKQGEAKTIKFTVTSGGSAVNISSAAVSFEAVITKGSTEVPIWERADADFNKTSATNGIVRMTVASSASNQLNGNYIGELTINFGTSAIDKSADISIAVTESVST